jgi:glycerol-3-phosphate responsive antiterminator
MCKYLFLLLFSITSWAYEKADAFIVTAQPDHYAVLSPVQIKSKIGLIIQNKTLSKIIGKLITEDEEILDITIKSGKTKSVEFKYSKNNKYYFLPIFPPFQKIELKRGERSYEVPAKR